MAAVNADFTEQFHPTQDQTANLFIFSGHENISDPDYQLFKNFQIFNISVRLFIGVLALNSNLLTVVAIGHYEYLRTCTNYFIAALAITDIIGGLNCLLVFINYVTPMSDETWLNMCGAEVTLNLISAGLNVVYILLISLDRFVFITYPLRYYSIVTPRLVLWAVLTPFILGVIQVMIVNLAIDEYIKPQGYICRGGIFPWPARFSMGMWFYVIAPITMLLYVRIAWIAYRQSRAIEQAQTVTANHEHKITKMLSLVLGVYIACYIPQFIVIAMKQFFTPETYVITERVSSWIWWINSCVNPFIYAWKNKDFNRAFRGLLGLKNPTVDPMQAN